MSEQRELRVASPARAGALVERDRTVEPQPRHDADDVLLRHLVSIVFRRRWLILGVLVASVSAAALYNHTVTPLYQARSRLLIEPSSSRVVTFRPVVDDEQGNVEYYQTQYEVLRSRALARRTVEKLNGSAARSTEEGPEPPELTGPISDLLDGLGVSPVKGSRLVDVKFTSSDPEYAARVANAVVQAYIEDKLQARLRAGREASAWLTERVAALRRQVDATQGTLQAYRERKDAVSLDDKQNIVVHKLEQLSSAVTAARTERIKRQAIYEQLRAAQQSGAPLDTLSPILSNEFIQKLKVDLAELQRERTQLAQQLGKLHPEMIRVETAIASAERRLDAEIAKAVDGIRNDFRAAEANERALVGALDAQQQEVLDLNRKSIGYGALQREANSTQQMFESVLQRVKEADLSSELPTSNARILDAAVVPDVPVWPRERLNLAVALIGGLVMGLGLVFGLEYLRPRIKTPEDIGDAFGLPLLGITPQIARIKTVLAGPGVNDLPPAFREALRGIRARILLSPNTADTRALAVTSTTSGEGKTLIASNLAISMALTGRRVLLADADMRRPTVHRLFELSRSLGLSDIIANNAKISTAVQESSIEGLFVLPAGTPMESPSDLLETDRFKFLVSELTEIFDVVILDCPPVMAVADALIIANAATAGLFVIGAGVTSREVAQAAIDRLVSSQAQMIGVVLNKADVGRHSNYYSAYYYDDDKSELRRDTRPTPTGPVPALTADR